MLSPAFCKQRQYRLLKRIEERKLDGVICGLPHHVYYFTGHLPFWQHQAAFVMLADGRTWLLCANTAAQNVAADVIVPFEANWNGTLRQEQAHVVAQWAIHLLSAQRVGRIGADASPVSSQLCMSWNGDCATIDPDLWQMRRVKDPDELELMKKAAQCCEAMYRRAREIIEPGISELTVFTELNAAAVHAAGEPLTALLGNDYASGLPGGPARNQTARAGAIYILDLGPVYRGYFSDNCRAFAVNRKPTAEQHKAWESVAGALKVVERLAKPGVRCRDLFTAVDDHFKKTRNTNMPHHLGHGVGLQPHEFPHLNLKWDDVLIEGETFTAEPGQYAPELDAGIRLENTYVVTKTGVESLIDFPLDL